MNSAADTSKQKLAADLKALVTDAEEVLRVTAGQAGEQAARLRTRIEERVAGARTTLADAQDVLMDKAAMASSAADDYVHEQPWQAVGIAAGIGLLLGLLVSRR